MDPYKVLGVSEGKIKNPSDLVPVRQRARKLYKRYAAEKKKFDAKKVLEAFDLIKKNLKGKPGEGANKILGRSRMERMMDKHFNHQTKEIKKDKQLKKQLRKARKGEARLHLPGDKERIPTGRGARLKKKRRRRHSRVIPKKQIETLEGLQRLAAVLPHKSKFTKGIRLVHRWMKEYMNQDNREFVFEVLQEVAELEFLTEDPDARGDVILVFEYLLTYYAKWFEEEPPRGMLASYWRLATVLACRCFTDDAFTLTATISKLNEALVLLENHRELLGDRVRFEDDHPKDERKERKRERSPSPMARGMKTPDSPMSESPVEVPWPEATDSEDEAKTAKAEMKFEVKAEIKTEVKTDVKTDVKTEFKTEVEAEVKEEVEGEIKDEMPDKDESFVRDENKVHAKNEMKDEVKEDFDFLCLSPSPSPGPSPAPATDAIDLSSDEDAGSKTIAIESEEDGDCNEALDIDSEDEWIKEEEISSTDSSDGDSVIMEEGDVNLVDDSVFPVPRAAASLYRLRAHLVDRCLATLFQQRNPLWARPKIDAFFQDLFYRRSVFAAEQRTLIEAWQSRIKTLQKAGDRAVGEANNPLEAHRPVVDSREERVAIDADSNAWAAKQTFDSRDKCGGSRVIR
mmetsp:Transcript_66738/g.186039  ORF Transcript_66738/g.186039 Transcript_66738/m.186039 type:complete len:627 (+) Transcript_66738:86-1966(+)